MIRSFGTPACRAAAHSPRETTFAPSPRAATAAMTAGTSFALTENCRSHGSGNAAADRVAAASRAARSVTWTGVPNRRAARISPGPSRPMGSVGRAAVAQSRTTMPTTELTRPIAIAPMNAATMVSEVSGPAGSRRP